MAVEGNTGAVAQLGERLNGIQEVRGSIPLGSMPRSAHISRCGLTLNRAGRFPPMCVEGQYAGIAQLVEHNLAKVGVAGSSPVSRSVVPMSGVVSSVG